MTIRDNRDYITVLLYSYYTTITGMGDPPKVYNRYASIPRSRADPGSLGLGSAQPLREQQDFGIVPHPLRGPPHRVIVVY